jgi:polyhydroxyalkanoate synthesis regulator phasin
MLQAYNVLARYLELERRRDEDALEERLEALEQSVMELAEAGARWGA